jgi:hypothetical protein
MLAASAYFVPRFDEAIANAPVIGGPAGALLRDAGLAGVSGSVTSFSDAAQSSGYTVGLVAGYADQGRTVLVVSVAPPLGSILITRQDSVALTDQFGHRYQLVGGIGDISQSMEALEFEPMAGLAKTTGARFSLRISSLGGHAGPSVNGGWALHGILLSEPASELAMPAPQDLGAIHVAFEEVRVSRGTIQVKLHVTGAGDLIRSVPNGAKDQAAFSMDLLYSDGTHAQPLLTHIESSGEVTTLWLRAKPGPYRLTVDFAGGGQFDRILR